VPITLARRQNLGWLLERRDGTDVEALSAPARDVLAHLRASGASFTDDIATRVRRLRIEVEEALCELVSAGLVTGDGFAGLRSLLHSDKRRRQRSGRARPLRAPIGTGRWAPDPPRRRRRRPLEARPAVREALRHRIPRSPAGSRRPAWRDLLRVYRRLGCEATCAADASWALQVSSSRRRALEALRAIRREEPSGRPSSACDPLNLVGIVTPGPESPQSPATTSTTATASVLEETRSTGKRSGAKAPLAL
jgi:ATP-dependent Lhr-like helicase